MARREPPDPPNLDEPRDRLVWARKRAGFDDATAAARRFHWNESTYRSHENGNRDLSRQAAARYARAFKISAGAGWLLYGERELTAPIDPETGILWGNLTDEQRQSLREVMRQMVRKTA